MSDLFPPTSADPNGHGLNGHGPNGHGINGGPPPASAPRLPATVRIAVRCLYAAAALTVLNIVNVIWDMATWGTYVDRVAANVHATAAQIATEKSDNTTGDIVGIVLFAVMATLYALAALLCRRGARGGQVLGLVGVALMLVCNGGAFIPVSLTALQRAAQDQQPALMNVAGLIGTVPAIPLVIVVGVLLLTGSARAFFRRMPPAPPGYMYVPAATWSPAAYPGEPPAWVYPVYGGVPPAQPFVYPPTGANPPAGYPPLPAGYPGAPAAEPQAPSPAEGSTTPPDDLPDPPE